MRTNRESTSRAGPAALATKSARWISAGLEAAVRAEHRIDPWIRPGLDRFVRPPAQALVQRLALLGRPGAGLGLAEERVVPDEAAVTAAIVDQMSRFMLREYRPGTAERGGNTKTYGLVEARFRVREDVPDRLRHGILATSEDYPAWVRFAGPGPLSPPDLDDNGILSLGVKVTGVPGEKLLDDERHTQDFTGLSCPTFTTPNIWENLKLQRSVSQGTGVLYFVGHPVDLVMQGLYAKTHANPLEARYWSCVPYLLGDGQAIQWLFAPRSAPRTAVPRRPGPDYLREAMVATLAERPVVYDMFVMVQTDPERMPIEDASIVWPATLSPWVPVAELEIPAQVFDSGAQLAFARVLSFNPWHCLPEHRPLGNQGRARRDIYLQLSRLRQRMNDTPHVEPTGNETFGPSAVT